MGSRRALLESGRTNEGAGYGCRERPRRAPRVPSPSYAVEGGKGHQRPEPPDGARTWSAKLRGWAGRSSVNSDPTSGTALG